MRKLFSILGLVLLYVTIAFGQAVDISITVSDNAAQSRVLNFGLDPAATDGIDTVFNESDLPPPPPGNAFDARWWLPPFDGVLSTWLDYRNAPAFPFTGNKEHVIKFQTTDFPITISWNLPPEIAATSTIQDPFGGPAVSFSGVGSMVITNTFIPSVNVSIDYVNIGPADPGPVFAVNPTSLIFGNVPVGSPSTLQLTVSNPGTTNPMSLTSASILNTDYVVAPNPPAAFPIVVNAGGSYVFDVTFTPTAAGVSAGNVVFEHDAPGSPSSVPVTGNGAVQGGDLVFDPQTREIFDNATGYSSTVRLQNYVGTDLKALQFKIVLDGLLNFRSISRGADVPAVDWNFSYVVAPGAFNPDGSRNDTIKVVILGNNTNQIPPGADYEIAVFEYDVIDIATEEEFTTVHFEEVVGGTGTPDPGKDAQVVAGPPQEITVLNRVFWGDVNMDNNVDLLDILLMIDFILDKVEFTQAQFDRGDIAPWASGDPAPTGDGEINALDLALLQNIVLTGVYPSGEPATITLPSYTFSSSLQKLNPGDDAALTFYINEEGIAVVLETIIKIKGLQVEFSKLTSSTSGMVVQTALGNGYYYQQNDYLRALVYDDLGATIGPDGNRPAEYLFLNMPFSIPSPRDLKLENIILAGEDNMQVDKFSVQIIYGSAPQLPTDYNLSQNYPNPFNPITDIEFTVPRVNRVTLKVYDMLGQEVRTLFTGWVDRGTYRVTWDGLSDTGTEMSAGSYVYRMTADEFVQSKKMILLK